MGQERLWIDHVILGVQDLEAAAKRLESEYGLFAWDAGPNPELGTRSMYVPLSPYELTRDVWQYLEVVTVEDSLKPYASFLSAVLAEGDRLVGWAVGTDDLARVGSRVHIEPQTWNYTWPDGMQSTFRTIMSAEWGLPFYIQYDRTEDEIKVWQGRSIDVDREQERLGVRPLGISWVEVGGEAERTREWLGKTNLPIRFSGDSPGISAVAISTSAGEIIIR